MCPYFPVPILVLVGEPIPVSHQCLIRVRDNPKTPCNYSRFIIKLRESICFATKRAISLYFCTLLLKPILII